MIRFKEFLTEARVSHVTIHDFDKFSRDKMKTGEGYHDFGWGIYFTENRGVVKFYRSTLPAYGRSMEGTFVVKADIPDESRLLYWDADYSKQPSRVKNAISKLSKQYGVPIEGNKDLDYHRSTYKTAGHFYKSLGATLGSDKAASDALDSFGIPGLRYLDAGSRSMAPGNQTFNYVIWNVDRINIMSRHKRYLPKIY